MLRLLPVRQRGLTLIELMISVAIGLVIVSALSFLFIGSRGTYRVNENVARLQETGRFALEWLSRDIRGAGYMGCLSSVEGRPTVVARTSPQVTFASMESGVIGYEDGAGWPSPPSSITGRVGDVITVRGADSLGVNLSDANNVANATIPLADNSLGVREGDVLLVSECSRDPSMAYVIYVTGVSPTAGGVTIQHGAGASGGPGNGNNGVVNGATSHQIKGFAPENQAKVYRFEEKTYFVGNNRGGRPALYRVSTSGGAEEVVENVEDLEIAYGEDTNGDGQPDAQTAADRRLRQVFTTTIALRNRLF